MQRIWKTGRAWWVQMPTGRIIRADCFAEAFCIATWVSNA